MRQLTPVELVSITTPDSDTYLAKLPATIAWYCSRDLEFMGGGYVHPASLEQALRGFEPVRLYDPTSTAGWSVLLKLHKVLL